MSWLRAQRRSAVLAVAALLLGMGISTDMAGLPAQPGSGRGGSVPIDGGGLQEWVFPPRSGLADGPAVILPLAGEQPGTATVAVGSVAIPARVLSAYRAAAAATASSDSGCGLQWTLLAAIGQVESGHARGGAVRADGRTLAPILGPVLSGGPGVAAIHDTDGGRYDGDRVWDRAVGPMQFIPTSWAAFGRDGDGDGVADPSDVDDAAYAAAGYLCNYGDLSDPGALRRAVYGYNHSWEYVSVVLAWMRAYAGGGVAATLGQTTPAAFSESDREQATAAARGPEGSRPSARSSGTTAGTRPAQSAGPSPGSGPASSPSGSPSSPPSASPTGSPSASPTGSPSPTSTASSCPTTSPTSTPTGSPTSSPTPSEPTPSPTEPTPTPTGTSGTACPTPDPASTPSATDGAGGSPAPSPTPTP